MNHHKNFTVAVYARAYEVEQMKDPEYLAAKWAIISKQLKVDKVYLETHRDRIVVDDQTLEQAKKFFADRGVETAAGIATVASERNRFETFNYQDPKDREFLKSVVEHTARHFNEIILDDFFFTDTKTDADIKAKGSRNWSRYRLDMMDEVARDLVIKPAKAVNPKVKIVIKFPNWYEHFQGLGYDLDREPKMFDGIYAGTETRQPTYNAQHLQQYESYGIVRYFDNIAPGRNGGGWVDTGGMRVLDRYAEQLWLTLFAKALEITLFDWRQMLQPIRPDYRADWQGQGTSFDFDAMAAPYKQPDGSFSSGLTVASAASEALEPLDGFLDKLGNPVGVAAYKPYQSVGDDFLHNYFGMIGVPMDIRPAYPSEASVLFLTKSAAYDPHIVDEIKESLKSGSTVVITSGLLQALQDRGIEEIVDCGVSGDKVLTDEFYRFGQVYKSDSPMILPRIDYLTNDSWELFGASPNGYPLILQCSYSRGKLDILAIPDNPADLYRLPIPALDAIRAEMAKGLIARLEGPSQTALFLYDNDTLIVESFLSQPTTATLVSDPKFVKLIDLLTGETVAGETGDAAPPYRGAVTESRTRFSVSLKPHSYRVFVLGK